MIDKFIRWNPKYHNRCEARSTTVDKKQSLKISKNSKKIYKAGNKTSKPAIRNTNTQHILPNYSNFNQKESTKCISNPCPKQQGK